MNTITAETRRESYIETLQDIVNKEERVLDMLRYHFPRGATAYELKEALCWDITSVRPRLTELLKRGKLVVIGKRVNPEYSPMQCAVYAISKPGELPLGWGC